MMKKMMIAKLAAFLAAIGFLFGSFAAAFPAVLAEETAAEEERILAPAGEVPEEASAGTCDGDSAAEEAPEAAFSETADMDLPSAAAPEEALSETAGGNIASGEAPAEMLPETVEGIAESEDAEEPAGETAIEPVREAAQENAGETPAENEKSVPEERLGREAEDSKETYDAKGSSAAESSGTRDTSGSLPEPSRAPEAGEREESVSAPEILLMNQGTLKYGDEVVLKALVPDVRQNCRLAWEARDSEDTGWFSVGTGMEYRFVLTEESAVRQYRVLLIVTD